MFAGPNGSGKSTIKNLLRQEWLGVYVNPDDIERELRRSGWLDVQACGLQISRDELVTFFRSSALMQRQYPAGVPDTLCEAIQVDGGRISVGGLTVDSYIASVLSDFLRHRLIDSGISLSFETVMSSEDKIAFLHHARERNYRVYLYFIATENVEINIARVQERVEKGGHPVPEDRIRKRYTASLSLLTEAIQATDRAYTFDNSGTQSRLVAEITDGAGIDSMEMEIKASPPQWLEVYVLSRYERLDDGADRSI
jgi:predicted ABC-type ATPase